MSRAFIWLLITAGIMFSSCQPVQMPNVANITTEKTVLVTQEIRGPLVINVVTPTPEPVVLPDTLTICAGREPPRFTLTGKIVRLQPVCWSRSTMDR